MGRGGEILNPYGTKVSILLLDANKKATLLRDHSTASLTEIQGLCYYILAGLAMSQLFPGSSSTPLFAALGPTYRCREMFLIGAHDGQHK